ncbi:NAD(P)-dependent dehydrogenase (short-subunit alcohol dehydrogenase family) [Elusimicrobium simillimum]|uniref:SDR family NAD(P)-dependent oxidoreductase n=1 Tax=Elusimicrobium simillimum TaxID=3143438 RepID=UPI003C702A3A
MGICKVFLIMILILVFSYALFVYGFYRSLKDPSSKAQLYDGPIIADEKQKTLDSVFNHKTKAKDVVKGLDLTGKNIVITAGHTGTGLETVKALASAGAQITVLARKNENAEKNLKGIHNVQIEYFDLTDPQTIDAFAKKYITSGKPLHVLINSAAVMDIPLERDSRGYERHFATNVLGHFQLTARLYPALEKANGARIINLSSRGHRAGGVIFDDINFEKTEYSGMRAYAQTKTALALLSVKEDEMLKKKNIRAYAVHPGPVPSTDLFVGGKIGYAPKYKIFLGRLSAKAARTLKVTEVLNFIRRPKNTGDLYKNVEQGAATTTWAASSPELEGKGGIYLEDCNIAPIVPDGSPAPFGVRPWALNKEYADKLWKICEEMTNIKFEI